MLWHVGNTTVRTPYRLQEALKALSASPLNGNLIGNEQEQAFAAFLHESEIVNVGRIDEGKDASDLGRKWRVALSQLGFITPQLTSGLTSGDIDPALAKYTDGIEGLSGRPFEVTENGHRLAQSDILSAQQECFLRSLVSYRIPSPLETRYKCSPFSPLRFVLKIIKAIEELGAEPRLTFQEFALFVQTATPDDGAQEVAKSIVEYRDARKAAAGNVRNFDKGYYQKVADEVDRKPETLNDYADLNLRYLKATGLLRNAGRGIALVPSRAQLASLIAQSEDEATDEAQYFEALWKGATLPTDDETTAFAVVKDLADKLEERGVTVEVPSSDASLADLEIARHQFELTLSQLDEVEFADAQADDAEEISAWMEALCGNGTAAFDGQKIIVPKSERPAYLEWVIWRAFLAIDSLKIPPWEARRFQIDQDFLPVHCAPGGGPDMVFEFEDSILVVEVTLTSSSRQEAAEGEPVRRHVASYAELQTKPVYGLFIALQIDSNTAHTFRAGDWYLKDDTKIALSIVPMTLSDFRDFFRTGIGGFGDMPTKLRSLLVECRSVANQDAPAWKASIAQIVASQVAKSSS